MKMPICNLCGDNCLLDNTGYVHCTEAENGPMKEGELWCLYCATEKGLLIKPTINGTYKIEWMKMPKPDK